MAIYTNLSIVKYQESAARATADVNISRIGGHEVTITEDSWYSGLISTINAVISWCYSHFYPPVEAAQNDSGEIAASDEPLKTEGPRQIDYMARAFGEALEKFTTVSQEQKSKIRLLIQDLPEILSKNDPNILVVTYIYLQRMSESQELTKYEPFYLIRALLLLSIKWTEKEQFTEAFATSIGISLEEFNNIEIVCLRALHHNIWIDTDDIDYVQALEKLIKNETTGVPTFWSI